MSWINGICCNFSVICGKSVTKRVNVGMNVLETSSTSPRQIRRKVPSTMAAASPRFRWRSSRSTSGVRSSCSKSEMKMMNASCGKNQNVDSRTVNVTPKRMDVR